LDLPATARKKPIIKAVTPKKILSKHRKIPPTIKTIPHNFKPNGL